METYISPKQCDNQQHQLIIPMSHINSDDDDNDYYQKYEPESFSLLKNENFDEQQPIDLTVSPTDLTYTHHQSVNDVNFAAFKNRTLRNYKSVNRKYTPRLEVGSFQTLNLDNGMKYMNDNQYVFCPSRRKKRKFVYTNEGKLVMLTESLAPPAFTQAKQAEILKAAQSLFSKRTRTLYHWMYPTASKQHIQTTVLTSWDSLAENEKAFYISQVLGRFGLSQTNLMVNPQLDTIKEPPPPPPFSDRARTKSRELQSAISSISLGADGDGGDGGGAAVTVGSASGMTFEEFEAMDERSRKRRGRPRAATRNLIRQNDKKATSGDFQDDPELSMELEKFAVQFNLNRLY